MVQVLLPHLKREIRPTTAIRQVHQGCGSRPSRSPLIHRRQSRSPNPTNSGICSPPTTHIINSDGSSC
ncbi:hypothetical protein LSH36_156g04003 [Paralvinella palmiformis]|uniref:Uncharacterized protein n=1 Tax=Paralvinella palmiformis TaxID=53620 RepID=A0AAD9N6R5_9ANNE|nr:hypothetical protein LSH36_156g04003 [Paralvinella palmiformis]